MLSVISAALAPGLALLCYFYLRDQYESEPVGMVLKTFIYGALLVFPVMMIQFAFETESVWQGTLAQSFVVNGLLEEFVKWFVVIYSAYHHSVFNERYDGIVYATAVSLGFATVENFFYLYAYGIDYALYRALLPVSSHALFGVSMGYYIGKAKFSTKKKTFLFYALMSAALLHGFYDFMLSAQKAWLYVLIPFMVYLWWSALKKVKLSHLHQQDWMRTVPASKQKS
ncbi:glutamic-type intramembrane protease PrsW [Tuberibacillus sp. Marseille-P3662]|uniref:glutamic-type intramembrane protease PrsW n=1 Tax=Tuberibacillus sp. Marseille-P3662 TaxID=1965358 RepID=UPI000A1C9147|nr:glutamic-type intramembrane protease PrsW [Tuberibacillus sp. Marseille-P3662]